MSSVLFVDKSHAYYREIPYMVPRTHHSRQMMSSSMAGS